MLRDRLGEHADVQMLLGETHKSPLSLITN
jgi:hypothetical protein